MCDDDDVLYIYLCYSDGKYSMIYVIQKQNKKIKPNQVGTLISSSLLLS